MTELNEMELIIGKLATLTFSGLFLLELAFTIAYPTPEEKKLFEKAQFELEKKYKYGRGKNE